MTLSQQIQLPSAWVDLAIKIGHTDMRKPRQIFRPEVPSWTLPEFQRLMQVRTRLSRVFAKCRKIDMYLPSITKICHFVVNVGNYDGRLPT
jgi:hypothetical protein